jgi:hypothetical protein
MHAPCTFFLGLVLLANSQPSSVGIDFEDHQIGQPPRGFVTAVTGNAPEGRWIIQEDATAPAGRKVLAQVGDDPTRNRFPLCIHSFAARNVAVSVQFKPVSGTVDQAGGIVFRYKDKDNYYLVRANALEDNVVLYKVQDARRTSLPVKGGGSDYGVKTAVPSGQWSTLELVAEGNLFTVHFNGKKLFEVEDSTFPEAGLVGLWTKADSITLFDNLRITRKD